MDMITTNGEGDEKIKGNNGNHSTEDEDDDSDSDKTATRVRWRTKHDRQCAMVKREGSSRTLSANTIIP